MGANTWGSRFQMTTFGESHGPALGVIIDGCPAGVQWKDDDLRIWLQRRAPGRASGQVGVSARNEPDAVEVLSGVYQGFTLGTPIAMMVRNQDARSQDYTELKERKEHRSGHADDLWQDKFAGHSDWRGGGRASGRETVTRVMAGAVAEMLLNQVLSVQASSISSVSSSYASVPSSLTSSEHLNVHVPFRVAAFVRQVGEKYCLSTEDLQELNAAFSQSASSVEARRVIDSFPARFPCFDTDQSQSLLSSLNEAQLKGDSWGGSIEVWADGVPRGWGQPVFHKLKSDLASAFLSIGATAGFELGSVQDAIEQSGSIFHKQISDPYGGIRGGISTGERLRMKIAFKPPSSLGEFAKKGRHDPCILIRAVPVIEAMLCLVLADHLLWAKTDTVDSLRMV